MSFLWYILSLFGCQQTSSLPNDSDLNRDTESTSMDVEEDLQDSALIDDLIEEPTTITYQLAVVGDVMMDSHIARYIQSHGVDYPWEDVQTFLTDATFAIANLETSVSTRGESTKPERFGFRSHPDTLQGLVNAGIDIVSTANNHILDYGPDAHLDTLEHLESYNIHQMGSGETISQAEAPVMMVHQGQNLCFIGYSDILPKRSWEAKEDRQGVASLKPPHLPRVYQKIESLKSDGTCDQLFMNIHWGYEYSDYYSKKQRRLARSFIDHGVDGIIGHHPHVLQGMELYKGKPILYSLGNFVFLVGSKEARNTGVFLLDFEDGNFTGGKIVPIRIYKCKANLIEIDSSRAEDIFTKLNKLSKRNGIQVDLEGNITLHP